MRTEWNVRFEAEAPLQAVTEQEEDEKAETVSAGTRCRGGERQRSLEAFFTVLSPVCTGLLQAGESRGAADDGGSLEDAPRHWWDRYCALPFWEPFMQPIIGAGPWGFH